MTSAQRTIIGICLLAAGLVLCLVAALVGWAGVQRWFAVSETSEAFDQLRRGRIEDARKLARKASARVPGEPTPALLAIDPKDEAGLERLVTMAHNAERHADKQACLAAIGLMRLAAGKPADVELAGTGDGRLLEAIAAVRANKDPGKLKPAEDEAPPHISVQRAAHTVLLRRAWQAGKVSETRSHAAALLLLNPRAPRADALLFLVAASSPLMPDDKVTRLGENLKEDKDAVIRAVAALLPKRREAFAGKWPKAVEGLP